MSDFIEIIGAETHNLKNVSVSIPKNKLVVITGLSWSGKSSLAFDTLYAEWQKRYLESLSTYARMIISDISDATKVREIRWLSPTIAINQKTVSNNPRSTVGTITEIYDFYRLLFTNIGIPFCPNHPEQSLQKSTIQNIFDDIISNENWAKFFITFPFSSIVDDIKKMSKLDISKKISDEWFIRFLLNDEIFSVADNFDNVEVDIENVSIIVDRLVNKKDDSIFETRLRDSLLLVSTKSNWFINIYFPENQKTKKFSLKNICPICEYCSQDVTISNFSFNSHYWACDYCSGLGYRTAFEESKIINENLSIAEGAILPWSSPYYISLLESVCKEKNINLNTVYKDLSQKEKDILLYWTNGKFEASFSIFGDKNTSKSLVKFEWIIPYLERRYLNSDLRTDGFLKNVEQYTSEQICRNCNWYRLKSEYLNFYIKNKNIWEIANMSVDDSLEFFKNLELSESQKIIAKSILKNIIERLEFLSGVGLGYMSLSRRANTLSGGESQRIRLATQIGTKLEGIIYVLDEPSIGLHPRDNDMLISNLKKLANIGNTVIVVEHDEDIMRECDYIIDIGPWAGINGGSVVFSGTFDEIIKNKNSETGLFLSNQKIISRKNFKKPSTREFISVFGARENNLKNINVRFPLGCITTVTGVSGSGKSSLVMDILASASYNYINKSALPVGKYDKIEWLDYISKSIIIDQSPIWRTPTSNVATYTGVFTYIREVFASSIDAKTRWFNTGRFSFNTKWWRCETCEWSGTKKIEMHFLPDVYVECETCKWTRYNFDTLSIKFKWKNIAEVLDMTIDEASEFFISFPRIKRILDVLIDVGLGYIKLWQSAPTLSGGESQRIKLAFDLAKRSTWKTLYILDEPTTGLHFSDVQKLLNILDALVEKWNSVIIIEHNLDIIANSDAIIDIGPTGWDLGWNVVFAWPREKILNCEESFTWKALKKYLSYKK